MLDFVKSQMQDKTSYNLESLIFEYDQKNGTYNFEDSKQSHQNYVEAMDALLEHIRLYLESTKTIWSQSEEVQRGRGSISTTK